MQEDKQTFQYRFVQQNDLRAFYAEVFIVLLYDYNKPGDYSVEIDASIDLCWHSALKFGIDYAWERRCRQPIDNCLLKVTVTDLHWMPVDTTNAAVAFTAAKAMWKALNLDDQKAPQFDSIAESFIFYN